MGRVGESPEHENGIESEKERRPDSMILVAVVLSVLLEPVKKSPIGSFTAHLKCSGM